MSGVWNNEQCRRITSDVFLLLFKGFFFFFFMSRRIIKSEEDILTETSEDQVFLFSVCSRESSVLPLLAVQAK